LHLDELKELLECPILLSQMTNPAITPSGHTVEGAVIDEWIGNLKNQLAWSKNVL